MFKACHLRDSPTTLCHTWLHRQSHHIIDGSKGNFGRICSITNAYVKGAIDVLGIIWVFHGYGAIFRVWGLEYKALFLEFVEMIKGFQFLETK
jgi:hypothetical protein